MVRVYLVVFNIFKFLTGYGIQLHILYEDFLPILDCVPWVCKKNEGSLYSQYTTSGDPSVSALPPGHQWHRVLYCASICGAQTLSY